MLKVVESMKKFIAIFFGFLLITLSVQSEEKLTIEKQLIGILGVTSGTVSNGAKELKTGVSKDDANAFKEKLEAAGATVELK